jgi:hypothetical protein
MAGVIDKKLTEERSKSFDLKMSGPLDSRDIISSLSNIDAELPIDQRYKGQEIFVQDEGRKYTFIGDVLVEDLVKSVMMHKHTVDVAVDLSASDLYNYAHGLNTTDLVLRIQVDGKEIPQFIELLDSEDPLYLSNININLSEWKANTGLTELPVGTKLIILY